MNTISRYLWDFIPPEWRWPVAGVLFVLIGIMLLPAIYDDLKWRRHMKEHRPRKSRAEPLAAKRQKRAEQKARGLHQRNSRSG